MKHALNNFAIIIPSYNEQKTINKTIKAVSKYGFPIVIDDFSSDNTEIIIDKSICFYHRNNKNYGYDLTLEKGFEIALLNNFSYAITVDADLQNHLDDLKKITKLLKSCDLVATIRNKKQRISEYIFGIISHMTIGINDPLSGLKGYNLKLYKDYKFISYYKSIGTWLLLRSVLSKKKIRIINIKINPREDESRFGGSISANIKIFIAMFFFIITFIKFRNAN